MATFVDETFYNLYGALGSVIGSARRCNNIWRVVATGNVGSAAGGTETAGPAYETFATRYPGHEPCHGFVYSDRPRGYRGGDIRAHPQLMSMELLAGITAGQAALRYTN